LAFEIFTDHIPTEACCFDDGSTPPCLDLTVADCLAAGGTPQGLGTDCTIVQCDPPPEEGACCLPNGNCVVTNETICLAHNGTYVGDGTTCTSVTCPSGCIPQSVTCPNGRQSIGSSYLAGAIDNFTPFPDPATPDSALQGYINNCTAAPGYALQFDELPGFGGVSANSWFGHTFTALPPGIISATLEFRARATPGAGGGLAFNDTIGFIDTISGCTRTDLWINRFMNLPEAGGTWNSGQVATFCLDLNALPKVGGGTTSVINDLASGRLSVFAQDDTGIDYLFLNITVCPCEYPYEIAIPVEINDNFAAPDSAPASPSAEIVSNITPPLKGFDNNKANARFVHTFTGLPPGIIGGSLEIRLRAHAGYSVNDSMALEFLNPSFRWSRYIDSLVPTGPWNAGTSKVVTLDLANLPPSVTGETSVIGDMTDGDLDVYVQDDTEVDYMILRISRCCGRAAEPEPVCPGDLNNDGWRSPADVSALVSELLPHAGSYYWVPCP